MASVDIRTLTEALATALAGNCEDNDLPQHGPAAHRDQARRIVADALAASQGRRPITMDEVSFPIWAAVLFVLATVLMTVGAVVGIMSKAAGSPTGDAAAIGLAAFGLTELIASVAMASVWAWRRRRNG